MYLSSIIFNSCDSLSLVFFYWCFFCLWLLLIFRDFWFPQFLSVCVFFIVSSPIFRSWMVLFIYFSCFPHLFGFLYGIYSFPSIVCDSLNSFKGFIRFLITYLNNFNKVGFRVFFLDFSCVGIFRGCCSKIAKYWWWHMALPIGDCVLMFDL